MEVLFIVKKLLQINAVINTGSTGRIAEGIGLQAMKQGWESYIAYGRYGNPSHSHTIKIGSKYDNYRHVLQTRLFDQHGLGSKKATRQFIHEIEKINPDLIHLHNIHGYYLNYEILFDYLVDINIPVVWTLHDCWGFTGHCSHYTYAKCGKWKTHCHHCPETNSYPKSYYDNSSHNFDSKKRAFTTLKNLTLVPVSKWLENEVKKSFLKNYKTRQIYTGLDLSVFQPIQSPVKEKYGLEEQRIYLGMASTWTERKGLKDFKELATKLKIDEIIVLVGLSESQIKSLPKNVIGIKRTENMRELIELYSASEALVNLTYEDTFPTTNIEALACGIPVITYATGGSPEAVDEQTGWVVPQGDLGTVRKILDKLSNVNREKLKENCRKRAEMCFDKTERFQEYVGLYENLL